MRNNLMRLVGGEVTRRRLDEGVQLVERGCVALTDNMFDNLPRRLRDLLPAFGADLCWVLVTIAPESGLRFCDCEEGPWRAFFTGKELVLFGAELPETLEVTLSDSRAPGTQQSVALHMPQAELTELGLAA